MAVFNKEIALDELLKFFKADASFSETMKAMENAQSHLQKIHDDAFSEGFEKGLEATDKVDKL